MSKCCFHYKNLLLLTFISYLFKFAKVRRIAIGIGNEVHDNELREIAGTSEDVIKVLSYGELISKLEKIMDLACENQHPGK